MADMLICVFDFNLKYVRGSESSRDELLGIVAVINYVNLLTAENLDDFI